MPYLLALLAVLCLSLATWLEPRFSEWAGSRKQSASLAEVVLGDSRRLLATHFFVKADAYFHSGYYPGVFDSQTMPQEAHLTHEVEAGHQEHDHHEESGAASGEHEDYGFLGPPKDFLDRFGRRFFPSRHTHLERPVDAKEVLPWLWISASLDPHRIDTFIVAAFWLRERVGQPQEAVRFLREGWRLNPNSYEILLELGRVYDENLHDTIHARNLWEAAAQKWRAQEGGKAEPDTFTYQQILVHLADLEERENRYQQALGYLAELLRVSPHTETIQKRIDEVKAKVR